MLYPIATPSRLLMDISGVWDFQLDDGKGFEEKWYEAPLPDPMTMPVPASYKDVYKRQIKRLRDKIKGKRF